MRLNVSLKQYYAAFRFARTRNALEINLEPSKRPESLV